MRVALFVLHARRAEHPLLDLSLFSNRAFSAASIATFCLGAALFGAMILMPLYFQVARGENALTTGLLLIPQGIGAGIGMALSGRITERLGRGEASLIGGVILVLATVPFVLSGASNAAHGDRRGDARARHRDRPLDHARDDRRVLGPFARAGSTTRARSSRFSSASTARSAPRSSPSCSRATSATRPTRPTLATSFADTYSWAMAVTLIALLPSLMLMGIERRKRKETGVTAIPAGAAALEGAVSVDADQDAERPTATETLRHAAIQMFGAERRLRSRDRSRAGELTHAQLRALATIGREQEMTAGQLARCADLNPATVTAMLDQLEATGVVERHRSTEDRRVCNVSLTSDGWQLLERERAHWNALWNERFADFSGRDLTAAAAVIQGITAMYDDLSARLDPAQRAPDQPD